MSHRSLVEPLLPPGFFTLIYNIFNEDNDAYGSAAMVGKLAVALNRATYPEDPRYAISRSCLNLEAQLEYDSTQGEKKLSKFRRNCLIKRLFAAFLIESLWHLRSHNARSAKRSLDSADSVYRKNKDSIDKAQALSSLGLVAALVEELDERLSRIEPCI